MLIAIVLCAIYLPNITQPGSYDDGVGSNSRLQRIDFKGATLLSLTILAILVPLELDGVKVPWSSPFITGLFGAGVLLFALFLLVEKRADEPILPLEIFNRRDAVMSFVIMGLQVAAQLGVGSESEAESEALVLTLRVTLTPWADAFLYLVDVFRPIVLSGYS